MVNWIRVGPADVEFSVEPDETVFEAARRHNIRWPSICQGEAECGICYLIVEQGEQNISELSRIEADRLAQGLVAGDPKARLACRARLTGDVTATRRGVRRKPQGGPA